MVLETEEEGSQQQIRKPFQVEDGNSGNHFKMKRMLIIYNMEFSREIIEQIFFLSCMVDNSLEKIEGQAVRQFVANIDEYKLQKAKLKQLYELLLDLRKKFLNDDEFRKTISTSCCLVEFRNQAMKQKLLNHFGIEKMGIIKQIQNRIKKIFKPEHKDVMFKGKVIKIERAPEPSDILWQNC